MKCNTDTLAYNLPGVTVTETAKKIFEDATDQLHATKCILNDDKKNIVVPMQLLKAERINCLHPDSAVMERTMVKNLVFDETKIRGKRVFSIAELLAEYFIVRLDVLETLIEEGVWPLDYTEIDVM